MSDADAISYFLYQHFWTLFLYVAGAVGAFSLALIVILAFRDAFSSQAEP